MEGVDPKKLFVGGVSQATDEKNMETYFTQFGAVELVELKRDPVDKLDPSGKRHRGFGFVTFKSPDSAASVLAHSMHFLDGKQIDPKPAETKSSFPKPLHMGMRLGSSGGGGADDCEKKVFLGGISAETTEDQVREYFESRGYKVKAVEFKYDQNTERMRGFGFVTFDSAEQVDLVCQHRFHEINRKSVEVKKAQPRQSTASAQRVLAQMPPNQSYHQFQGGYGTPDYSRPNDQSYPPAHYFGNGQYYPSPAMGGYGGQYGAPTAAYGYDPSSNLYTQSTAGVRQGGQGYYQQQPASYGQGGGQQMAAGYRPDTNSYVGRTAYSTDPAAYGGQSAYGGGGAPTSTAGHYPAGTGSYGNH